MSIRSTPRKTSQLPSSAPPNGAPHRKNGTKIKMSHACTRIRTVSRGAWQIDDGVTSCSRAGWQRWRKGGVRGNRKKNMRGNDIRANHTTVYWCTAMKIQRYSCRRARMGKTNQNLSVRQFVSIKNRSSIWQSEPRKQNKPKC